jgi:hypothetical protein
MVATLILGSAPMMAQAELSEACQSVQTCVDAGVDTALSSCTTATPECDLNSFPTNKTSDRFAASAGDIADRAIELKKCETKTKKFACNACYKSAQAPLKNRFFGKLFHGLLAEAVLLIEAERKEVCGKL